MTEQTRSHTSPSSEQHGSSHIYTTYEDLKRMNLQKNVFSRPELRQRLAEDIWENMLVVNSNLSPLEQELVGLSIRARTRDGDQWIVISGIDVLKKRHGVAEQAGSIAYAAIWDMNVPPIRYLSTYHITHVVSEAVQRYKEELNNPTEGQQEVNESQLQKALFVLNATDAVLAKMNKNLDAFVEEQVAAGNLSKDHLKMFQDLLDRSKFGHNEKVRIFKPEAKTRLTIQEAYQNYRRIVEEREQIQAQLREDIANKGEVVRKTKFY